MTAPTDHRTTRHARARPDRRVVHRLPAPAPQRRTSGLRDAAGEQLAVAGGQLLAGTGNLVFALLAARLLAPGAFAELSAFLALYLLIHVPAGSLSAGSALSPGLAVRARRRALAAGGAVGAALAVLAIPLSALLDLSAPIVLAAALSAPTAGLLALDRGRLYGLGLRLRLVGSLLAEPGVRLTLGVALAALAGPVGGALAVVVAGWAALAVARLAPPRNDHDIAASNPDVVNGAPNPGVLGRGPNPAGDAREAPAGAAVAAFLLLALVQNQDVLLANAVLGAEEAGRFAVLSTLGGAAAFATTTVPLMLLSRATGRDALRAALGVAAALGLAAVAVVALSPDQLVTGLFGARYEAVGAIAVPYVLAMALLGVARVLVAHACKEHRERPALALLAGVAVMHVGLIVLLGDDAAGVATATLAATATLTAGAAGLAAVRVDPLALLRRRDVAIVAGLAVTGLVVRLLATRGIWLDEATSIHQAQMPLGALLDSLRSTDVHPPLHHVVLWGTVRLLGTDELAVRLPSLIAATALIPLLYAAARDIYDRQAGLAAAALGVVAPFAVWYAQEARMYALFMVFALLAVWMQVRILRGGGKGAWLGYVLAAAALVYTQYFGLLLVGVQQLVFVAALRPRRRECLLWTGALMLLLAPLVPFALDQFAANEAAGRGFQQPSQAGGAVAGQGTPGAYAAITNVVWAVLGYHSNSTMTAIAALWPLALLLALALLGRGRSWPTLLVVACATVPALALLMLGQAKPFVFEVRYFVGTVPLALLLIARALTSWGRWPAVAVAGATAVLAVGLADQQFNGSNPRVYDFRGALADIEARAKPGDTVVYSPFYLDHVVAYYEKEGLRMQPLEDGLPRPRRGQRVFLLASFLDKQQFREATDEAVRTLNRRHELVHRDERPQIRTWEFR